MAENGSELRRIVWTEAFPFVRLFRTLPLALNANRLLLAAACIILSYLGGRVQDKIWPTRHGVNAQLAGAGVRNEIEAYATSARDAFQAWVRQARNERVDLADRALQLADKRMAAGDLRAKLQSQSLRELLASDEFERDVDRMNDLVDARLKAGLKKLADKKDAPDYAEQRDELLRAADRIRIILAGKDAGPRTEVAVPRTTRAGGTSVGFSGEERLILSADPEVTPEQRVDDEALFARVKARASMLRQDDELIPRGPYISLLKFESHCLAAAVQGVCSGHWGLAGDAFDPQPAMLGSLATGVRGVCWLVTQRPWYALVCGLFNLLVFAFFGGALCRSAAVQSARDESISLGTSLRFAGPKLGGFLMAPILPLAIVVGIAVILALGGLVGAIPRVGELLTGVLYFLAVLGGFAAAFLVLAVALGFPLMWPTIAAEGSDGFDALSRACSYITSRIWHAGFYAGVLLLYGALSLVLVRGAALVTLKLTHDFSGFGMSVANGARLDGVSKLDALWQMPAWSELSLLPDTGPTPFWGTFFQYPLNGTEKVGAFLVALWVYLLVSLVAAFVVSFFFCGSTQMYFLLRREVDATDWNEVYYEEPEEPPLEPQPAPAPAAEVPPEEPPPALPPAEPAFPPPSESPPDAPTST